MSDKSQNVQDVFLNHVRKNKTPVTVFLVNGVKLQGIITWFDNFCVLLRREAAHLGWACYFARLVGAADAAADKPDPAPIHLALEGSGIAAGPAVWYVGDTAVDMECALNAGCVPVLVGPAKPEDAEFSRHRPQVAFDDCSGLFLHIRTL